LPGLHRVPYREVVFIMVAPTAPTGSLRSGGATMCSGVPATARLDS